MDANECRCDGVRGWDGARKSAYMRDSPGGRGNRSVFAVHTWGCEGDARRGRVHVRVRMETGRHEHEHEHEYEHEHEQNISRHNGLRRRHRVYEACKLSLRMLPR